MSKKSKTDAAGVKLPKKIGKMKVPKKVRRAGEALIDKANSPEGRRAIAAGVSLLATAALSSSSKQAGEAAKDAAKKGAKQAGAKAGEQADAATEAGKHFAQALGTAALAAFTKAFEKPNTKH